MASRLKQEYVIEFFNSNGYILPNDFEYVNGSTLVDFSDLNGYLYRLTSLDFMNTMKNGKPVIFSRNNPHTIENIHTWIKNNNKPFELLSNEYIKSTNNLEFECNNCHEKFYRVWEKVINKDLGCCFCSGHKGAPRKLSEEDIKKIIELYNSGKCAETIRKKYCVRNTTITDILKNNDIKIKKTYEYYTSKEMATQRKYYFDEDIFENIDTHDKAYWLGFLFADGNVYVPKGKEGGSKGIRIEITLKEEDYYHLQNFSQFLHSNYPVKQKIVKLNGKEILVYRIAVNSVKMGNDLIKHGCVPNKSLILEYPNNLDEKYFGSFLCGYFDGDGCLSFSQYEDGKYANSVAIMGTLEFLSIIKLKLNNLGIKTSDVYKTESKAFNLRISNYSHADFYNLIYNKASYMLGRKFDKFRDMLDSRNKEFEMSEVAKLFRYIH
jgi:TusA-related sulfurtransferase/intein-encoded DNA endonuclease-like protein